MPLRLTFFLAISWLSAPSGAAAAITLLHELPVRVYDTAGVPADTKAEALAVAAATLARASVDVVWIRCDSVADARRCGAAPAPGEIIVRFVQAPGGGLTRRAGAALRAGLPLGDAFVDGASASGVLATIYVDRVTTLAAAARVDVRPVLGRAVAHELAHLLLGSGAHSARGLMRPVWTAEALRRGRDADWMLTAAEAAAIRQRLEAALLSSRGLPASPAR